MSTTPDPAGLTRGRLLARNTILNLVGHGLPLVVALFAIPILIRGLGTERFGVLTLAWMAIGYFSLFDFGLGRALTQLVAEKLGTGEDREIPVLAWTAMLLMFVLGAAGGLLLALLSPWLTREALNIPANLQPEALSAFYLLALSLPWVTSTAALRGVLEAQQRFGLINAVRVPMGILTYLGPLFVLPFSSSLVPVVAVLVATRVVAWLVHLLLCLRTAPLLRRGFQVRRRVIGPLLRFGSWMTVTNLVSPIMVYLDRFLIGALLSMTAVAFYVTPYEAVIKLLLVPGALLGVLFPAFAASFVRDRAHTLLLFDRGMRVLVLVLFPVILFIVAFAPEGLALWVGAEFAKNSTRVLQWLAIGVFVNSIAQVPFTVIQGAGRPDITGKLHLVELPVYLVALWWLVGAFGIEGAAIAWVARVAADAVVLFVFTVRFLPGSAPIVRRVGTLVGASVAVFALAALPSEVMVRTLCLVFALPFMTVVAWHWVLSPGERMMIHNRFTFLPGGAQSSV